MDHSFFRLSDIVLFVFPSTEQALEAEEALNAAKLQPGLHPLPIQLGLGCGTAVQVPLAKVESARALLERENIAIDSIWQGTEKGSHWHKLRG